jgi:hypothetical protein
LSGESAILPSRTQIGAPQQKPDGAALKKKVAAQEDALAATSKRAVCCPTANWVDRSAVDAHVTLDAKKLQVAGNRRLGKPVDLNDGVLELNRLISVWPRPFIGVITLNGGGPLTSRATVDLNKLLPESARTRARVDRRASEADRRRSPQSSNCPARWRSPWKRTHFHLVDAESS